MELNAELRESGELVEAQALTTPELAKFVVSDGGTPVVTDGPFPESKARCVLTCSSRRATGRTPTPSTCAPPS